MPGLKPYPPLQLAGRDVYIREGCYNCHSQMIRALASEVLRYGHYSVAGESVYDHPFQWGSKRTGPDLARIGGRYSDDWQRVHLANPRNVVPESIMPGYPWLNTATLSAAEVESHMRGLAMVGLPYTDADYASVAECGQGQDRDGCARRVSARPRQVRPEGEPAMIAGLITALLIVIFCAIVGWAYSSRRKQGIRTDGTRAAR